MGAGRRSSKRWAASRSHSSLVATSGNATTIDADWESYCREIRDILDALVNRLTDENRELLPLIERSDLAA